jgi:hypothetical protein
LLGNLLAHPPKSAADSMPARRCNAPSHRAICPVSGSDFPSFRPKQCSFFIDRSKKRISSKISAGNSPRSSSFPAVLTRLWFCCKWRGRRHEPRILNYASWKVPRRGASNIGSPPPRLDFWRGPLPLTIKPCVKTGKGEEDRGLLPAQPLGEVRDSDGRDEGLSMLE